MQLFIQKKKRRNQMFVSIERKKKKVRNAEPVEEM